MGAGMSADEVAAVVDWLDTNRITYQVNGGWAVDALAGRQTREHEDLDVFLDAKALDRAMSWLRGRGYSIEANELPARVQLRDGASAVDLHPMTLGVGGDGTQRGAGTEFFVHAANRRTTGTIGGRSVVVADAGRLLELRTGYAPRERDLHDLGILKLLVGTESGRLR